MHHPVRARMGRVDTAPDHRAVDEDRVYVRSRRPLDSFIEDDTASSPTWSKHY